jgi:hydroxymethylglutaryl-CoA lyase
MKRAMYERSIKFFDITLRDGLQGVKTFIPTKEKCNLANFIYKKYKPHAMEIGSIVSPKIVPQFEDSIEVFNYCKNKNYETDLYMLVPNLKALDKAREAGVKNFSFITSTSDAFQKKNTNKDLCQTKKELNLMIKSISDDEKVKIYLSCINECPISGKIDTNNIISEIYYYYYNFSNINELCLSDTCGTLTLDIFEEIMINIYASVDYSLLGLHLHQSLSNSDIMRIINRAKIYGISKFDVCAFSNLGGCSVTIGKDLPRNLHYKKISDDYETIKNNI